MQQSPSKWYLIERLGTSSEELKTAGSGISNSVQERRLYALAIVAVVAVILAFVFSGGNTSETGQLTLNIQTVGSSSFNAPNQFLVSDDHLSINTNLVGSSGFHAMGLYRVVSTVGDLELVRAFSFDAGEATSTETLRAVDLINGQTDFFAVSILGCEIGKCTDPVGMFPMGERFDISLPRIPVGQPVGLEQYPIFLVLLNV